MANDTKATELKDDQLDQVHGGQGISQQVRAKDAVKPNIQSTTGGSIAQGDTIDNNDNLPG